MSNDTFGEGNDNEDRRRRRRRLRIENSENIGVSLFLSGITRFFRVLGIELLDNLNIVYF
jgi:hypothetical protein